jgi:fengycin family lipopeptide synthetase D
MIPAYFVYLDEIPLTPTHKVNRLALPPPDLKAGPEYVPPGNPVEMKLAALWAEVLGIEIEVIGINHNFFRLGGQSLKATILISKIHMAFHVKIPLAELFNIPTVRGMAEYIKTASQDKYVSIPPVEKRDNYPLSSAQKRLFVLQYMNLDSTAYNMQEIVPLPGEPDMEKLKETFNKIINRHESLRTSFHITAADPVQKIHDNVEFEIEYHDEATKPSPSLSSPPDFIRPFDLSNAPLLRIGLIKTGRHQPVTAGENPDTYILVVDLHHIITDGTSQSILGAEFVALYTGEELPSLKIQYKDYVGWLNSREQQELIKQQEAHWLNLFSDDLPVLNLRTDYPRPAVRSFEGRSIDFMLDRQETEKLNQLAKKEDATMFITLLAILYVLLSKICRQEDIIIGTAIAGRRHADIQNIVGFFVNTLALRNFPTGEKTFIEFLKEVKERTITAFENQEYQFEELVDKLLEKRDPARNPIFDIMFALHNQGNDPSIDTQEKGAIQNQQDSRPRRSLFDLLVNAFERGNQLMLSFEYDTKLFKEETIKRFMKYYKNIVTSIIQDNDIKLDDIKISHDLLGSEKKTMQIEFDF